MQNELQKKSKSHTCDKKLSHFYYLCKIKFLLIEDWIIQHELAINDSVTITSPSFRGYTPLHFAVKSKSIEIVKVLLKNGANLTIKNAKGQTPLHLCMDMIMKNRKKPKEDFKKIGRFLLIHGSNYANPIDNMGLSHFHIAVFLNDTGTIQNFIQQGIEINNSINCKSPYWSGYTSLHIACKYSLNPVAHLLLQNGANLNLKDAIGLTPLHYAIKKGNEGLVLLLFSSLNKNYVNPFDCVGISLLHAFCKFDYSKHDLENFLSNNVDVNLSVMSSSPLWAGYTPLHVAVNEKRMRIVRILIKHGADVNIEDANKISPLQLAIHKNLIDDYLMDLIFEYNKKVGLSIDNVRFFQFFSIFLKEKSVIISRLSSKELPVNYTVPLNYSLGLSGYTPLHFAVERGDVELIEILLENGANIYIQDNNGLSPLHLASERRNYIIVEKILSFSNGALENLIDNNGVSHLHIACIVNNVDIVNRYLESGVQVNLATKSGETPLHFAVKFNCVATVKLLLKNNAYITVQEITNGLTPLHVATENQNSEIINIILSVHSNTIINPVNKMGFSHFHIICMNNRLNLVHIFLNKGVAIDAAVKTDSVNYPGFTSLHFAVKNCCVEIVKLLLKYGANINVKNKLKKVPLHYAFKLKHRNTKQILDLFSPVIKKNGGILEDGIELSTLHIACMRNDYLAVKDFLKERLDIIDHRTSLNCPSWPGYTPLHFAVKYGTIETVELLLRNKANVHITDKYGFTALHFACCYSKEKIVEKLLASNSNPGVKNVNGLTPLRLAKQAKNNQIVHMVLSRSFSIGVDNPMDNKGFTYFHVACIEGSASIVKDFLDAGADVDETVHSFAKKFGGYTPLHIAVECRNIELVNLLLWRGANVNAVTGNEGFTPLHIACHVHDMDLISILLKHGANPNIRTFCGNALVSMAVQSNYADVLQIALQHGADPNLADYMSYRPLHLAIAFKREDLIDILLQNGTDAAVKSFDGKTFIHSMMRSLIDVQDESLYVRIITRLLEHGCDLDARDESGRSALHRAYWPVNIAGLAALLKCGADVDVKDPSDRTVISYFAEITSSRVPWTKLYQLFHQHLRLRRLAGFTLNRINEDLYRALFDIAEDNEDEVDELDDHFIERVHDDFIREVYKSELGKMEELRFGGYTSLRDVFGNVNKMAMHLARRSSDGLSEFFRSDKLDQMFPVCRCLLMMQYAKALKRRDFMIPAQTAITRFVTSSFELRWNDECSEAVIQHLSEDDLRSVAAIYDSTSTTE